MSDINSLNGSSVRDAAGRTGRVVSVTEAAVNVAWMSKGLITEETGLERTTLDEKLQVLTLKDGWQSLTSVAGIVPPRVLTPVAALTEELVTLFERSKKKLKKEPSASTKKKKVLFGKKKHSPYKDLTLLGPGPDHSFGTREVSKRTKWDCTRAGYLKQTCTLLKKDAKGRLRRSKTKKKITIKPEYRKKYNAAYKAWRKAS